MKPDDPQQMEALGPADDPWAALSEQERLELEAWLQEYEECLQRLERKSRRH